MTKSRTTNSYILGVPPPITWQTKGVPHATTETTAWSKPQTNPKWKSHLTVLVEVAFIRTPHNAKTSACGYLNHNFCYRGTSLSTVWLSGWRPRSQQSEVLSVV